MRSRFRRGDWFLVGALIIGTIAALLSLVEIVKGRDEIFLFFLCFFVVAVLACGVLLSLRMSRWWVRLGMVAAVTGLLSGAWSAAGDWPVRLEWLEYVFGYGFFVTTFLCYAALATALPLRGRWTRRLRWVAVGSCGVFTASMISESFDWSWMDPAEWLASISGGVTAALAVFLPVLALWNDRRRLDSLESTSVRVDLTCPRCGEKQELAAGHDRCRKCRLVIAIDVREPRCSGCGFLLYRFAGDNCPECGRTIPPGEQWRDR